MLEATRGLALSETQKNTLRPFEQRLLASNKSIGAAFNTVRQDLAAQVRAGAIDRTQVQADESVMTSALQAHVAEEADTLNALHATLDPSQRTAVVAAVRAEPPGQTEKQAPMTSEDSPSRLERLTRELDLDATQRQQVGTLLGAQPPATPYQREGRREQLDALLTAFESDSFDARTVLQASPPSPAAMVHDRIQRKAAFLSQLLPILRPDQRSKLAASIETAPWGQRRSPE
jgi:Spy/CpxP family protein refolding chaperone